MAVYDIAAPRSSRRPLGLSLSSVFFDLAQWRKNTIAAAQLRAMPDHILEDLGLTRAEVNDAVRNGRR